MELNTPPPVPAEHPLCRTCGQGALITRKTFRMSGPVLVIGFILLVPSFLGMLFGILMFFLLALRAHRPPDRATAIFGHA